ncbi:Putative patatin-like phospholipase domain, Acyl transferase/acyl hydrolase/lysophospholipase [Septoria linicola]|uniref:Patatin-like phospholipase domain, Acyl transferase/acyl hydrolase/lysophospholipase n=1 Tax=Septoria linicola TaxID=215465 RepID=A0A9Q9ENX5_9PEZI|nr:Putative patatin-like phospholipase domain, Acyl transferase/acyl hydrolase/lysophospholipase [Septoria linicola]
MDESTASLAPGDDSSQTRHSSRAPSVPRREETGDSEKAGRVWSRGVADAWDPCILTCDGGGIRGYSSLIILKALMHEVWEWEQYYDKQSIVETRTDSPTEIRADSPTSYRTNDQAQAGAVRGRQGEHHSLGNDSYAAAEAHGVSTDLPDTKVAPAAAAATVVQDELTSDLSTKKAITEEELLPCHYFDFMYGTSTGGLIATILGRLRMTVTEALELYRKVGNDLFGKRRSSVPLRTKYHHEPLEQAVRDIVSSRCSQHEACDGNDLHPLVMNELDSMGRPIPFDVDRPRVCQSCCLAATHNENINEAYLLRSYPQFYGETTPNWITRYNEGADAIPIWQVTRATSAAPFYFQMVKAIIDDIGVEKERHFKDGGIRENNPSAAALSEFHALYEGKAKQPALMLSVGTGRPNQARDGFATNWPSWFGRMKVVNDFMEKRAVLQNLLIKYTEGERQHQHMREYAQGEHTWYKRLNVSHGLENMPLDSWERGKWTDPKSGEEITVPGGASLTKMEEITEEYLSRPYDKDIDSYAPPSTMLRQAAQKLVLQRRAREELGGVRWDTFVGKKSTPVDHANGFAG